MHDQANVVSSDSSVKYTIGSEQCQTNPTMLGPHRFIEISGGKLFDQISGKVTDRPRLDPVHSRILEYIGWLHN